MNARRGNTFRSKPKPMRLKKRRNLRRLITLVVIFLIVGSFIGVLGWLSRAPSLSIQQIAVSGATITSTDEIKGVVEKVISGGYGGILSRRNVFLYPAREMEASLASAFPAIASAKSSLKDGHTLSVEITEREPFAIWCNGKTLTALCFFIDSTGIIYAVAPNFSGGVYVRFYGSVEEEPLGARFLPEEDFKNLSFFLSNIKNFGIKLKAVDVSEGGQYTLLLKNGAEIRMGNAQDFSRTLENIQSIIQEMKIKNALLNDISSLEYLDLRFGNKVFYKWR